MRSYFELFVALRYLRSKRKEVFISLITIISILGVALSVAVLDMTLAIMTGFESALQTKLLDANAHVVVRRLGGDVSSYNDVATRLRTIAGVTDVSPFTFNQAMITSSSGARGVLIRGIPQQGEATEKLKKLLQEPEAVSKLFTPAAIEVLRPDDNFDTVQLPPIIVGKELRDRLGLPSGAPVTLFAPQFSASPQGLIPKLKRFVVVDFYSSGLIEYEGGLAYVGIGDAQRFFGMGDAVTGLEITVKDLFQAPKIAAQVSKVLEDFPERYYATDWTEQNRPLWEAIQLEKKVYFIVLLLLILIASFSIVSTLVMVVMEKSRDIAVLKSMGTSDRRIMVIFLIQGIIIGTTGIVLGSILGYGGCVFLREYGFEIDERVFSLSQVPVEIVPANMLLVAISAFIITAAAGLYPARRAARVRPADSLRFE